MTVVEENSSEHFYNRGAEEEFLSMLSEAETAKEKDYENWQHNKNWQTKGSLVYNKLHNLKKNTNTERCFPRKIDRR